MLSVKLVRQYEECNSLDCSLLEHNSKKFHFKP